MREEIELQGGTVEKFIGDAVMAVFGVPVAHEDDPSRALRAALRMRHRLTDLNCTLDRRHGIRLSVRTGVNTGEVLAVARQRLEGRLVTGDSVNVAARLEQSAAPGQILASERTIRGARGFRFVEIAPLSVKGKELPLKAYDVLDVLPGHERETSTRTPMLGRQQEMELLQTLYRRMVTDDRPNLVTIYGEAGVGKSRLVEEFQSWAEALERLPTVVHGRCLPYGEGVAYWPLAEIIKRHAGVQDSDLPATAVEKIQADASSLFSVGDTDDPERAAAALAVTVSLEDPSSPLRGMEPRQVRLEVARVAGLLLGTRADLAGRRDHPGPPLGRVGRARPARGVDRPGGTGGSVPEPARRELTAGRLDSRLVEELLGIMLEPLGPDESERLLDLLVEGDRGDLPPSVRQRILVQAGGNFFLEQIVDHLIEKTHRGDGDGGSGTEALEAVEIPDTVQAVLAARIDLLEPLEKRVLRRPSSARNSGAAPWLGCSRPRSREASARSTTCCRASRTAGSSYG